MLIFLYWFQLLYRILRKRQRWQLVFVILKYTAFYLQIRDCLQHLSYQQDALHWEHSSSIVDATSEPWQVPVQKVWRYLPRTASTHSMWVQWHSHSPWAFNPDTVYHDVSKRRQLPHTLRQCVTDSQVAWCPDRASTWRGRSTAIPWVVKHAHCKGPKNVLSLLKCKAQLFDGLRACDTLLTILF